MRRWHVTSRRCTRPVHGGARISESLSSADPPGMDGHRSLSGAAHHVGTQRSRRSSWPKPGHHSPCEKQRRQADLVERQFCIRAPGRLHVAGITYARPASGSFAYAAFVNAAHARGIMGWAPSQQASAPKICLCSRRPINRLSLPSRRPHGLVHHSDHGTQYNQYAVLHVLEGGGHSRVDWNDRRFL